MFHWIAISIGTIALMYEAFVSKDLFIAGCALVGIAICAHEIKHRIFNT